jgi:O-antigen/teichoic acid export membrane protein
MSPLALAAVLSQGISVLTIPVLARYYTAESFGIFGLVVAVSTFSTTYSTLKLDSAIAVSHSAEEIVNLKNAALLTNVVFCFFNPGILVLLMLNSTESYSKTLLLVFTFFFGLIAGAANIFTAARIQAGDFKAISSYTVCRSLMGSVLQIILALFWPTTTSLLVGALFSQFLAIFFLKPSINSQSFLMNPKVLLKVIRNYSTFTKFNTLESVVANMSTLIPVLMLGYFYGAQYLGYYYMGERIFSAISQVGVESVRLVITNRFMAYADNPRVLTQKTVLASTNLFFLGTVVVTLVFIMPYSFFRTLIGDEFEYLYQVMTLFAITWLFRIILVPIYVSLIIRRRQVILFKYSLFRVCLSLSLIFPSLMAYDFKGFLWVNFFLTLISSIAFVVVSKLELISLFKISFLSILVRHKAD